MIGAMLAGFVTSFATAAVELSATLMLVSSQSDAPLAYGIWEFMQSAAGRGPGAALGITAVLIVGIATYISHRIIQRSESQRSAGAIVAETV
jgi:iron(III) transport system permease protein